MIPRVIPRPERLKKCSGKCGEWLSVLCFDLDHTRADGRRSVCKECRHRRRRALDHGAERLRPWQTKESIRRRALALGIAVNSVYYHLDRGRTVDVALRSLHARRQARAA